MSEPVLKIVKMSDSVILPKRANPTDSGFDLYFNDVKCVYKHFGGNNEIFVDKQDQIKRLMDGNSLILPFGWRALIGTGIKATVGPGFELQVRPRSGLALKQGLTVLNTPGTIDEAYRDEICVILINLSRQDQRITIGDRIAQLVVVPVVLCDIQVVTALDGNDRGGGFGHSGK